MIRSFTVMKSSSSKSWAKILNTEKKCSRTTATKTPCKKLPRKTSKLAKKKERMMASCKKATLCTSKTLPN